MSPEFAMRVLALLRQGRLFLHPLSLLEYMADGELLTLPIARRPTAKGYKKPHWAPVCLWLVPP